MVTAPIDGIEVKVSLRLKGIAALMAGVECTSLRVRVEDGDHQQRPDGWLQGAVRRGLFHGGCLGQRRSHEALPARNDVE